MGSSLKAAYLSVKTVTSRQLRDILYCFYWISGGVPRWYCAANNYIAPKSFVKKVLIVDKCSFIFTFIWSVHGAVHGAERET